jgi:hypothetical protein
MNRRDLLKYLLMTPAATFVDYEKLLWMPGEKKIFIPAGSTIQLTTRWTGFMHPDQYKVYKSMSKLVYILYKRPDRYIITDIEPPEGY